MCDTFSFVRVTHTYVWLTWLSHGTHTNENVFSFALVIRVWVVLIRVCDSYAWVISHIRMRTSSHSYVRMRTSSHSHVRMRTSSHSHVRLRTIFHSYVWLVSDLFVLVCVTHTIESCPTNEWERVTRSDSWRDSFKRVIWRMHMCIMTPFCAMTYSHVWYASFMLAPLCAMTYSHV